MSKRIKGITIEIDGSTTGLQNALQDVNKRSRDLQSELREVERGLKFDPSNVELLAQKQQLLTEQVGATTDKLNRLKEAQEQVEQQFKSGEIGADQYRAFQREIVESESKLNHFENQLDQTNNSLKNNTSIVDKLGNEYQQTFDQINQAGVTMTAIGGTMFAGLGMAVKVAADNETQLAKMETALQGNVEAAKEYYDWAKEFGKTTPFEAVDVVDATVKLKAYGIEAKDTLTSIGNMAAGMGKGLDQAVEAVADAQTGELERLKEFGITKQMLIDKALELGKGEIVNAKGQITDMAGLNDALFAIMDERFKGGMERQAKTLNGQMSALKDSFTQIMGSIGEALFPIVTKIAEFIQKLTDKFNDLSPSMKTSIAIATAVAAAIAVIGGPLLILIGFIPQIIAGFTAIGAVFTALVSPVGLIVLAIGGLIAIGVLLYKNWDTVKAKAGELASVISTKFNEFKNAISESMNGAKSKIENIWGQIKSYFTNISLYGIGKDIIQGLINGIGSMASAVWKKAKDIADSVKNTIKSALKIQSPSRVLMEMGENVGEGLQIGMENTIQSISRAAENMANATLPTLPQMSANNNSQSNISQVIEVPIYLDGREIAHATADHINTIQYDQFSSNSRMRGVRRW